MYMNNSFSIVAAMLLQFELELELEFIENMITRTNPTR